MEHHQYFEGKVQSLGFRDGSRDYTVGVVERGIYDFGGAGREVTITVLTGYLKITDETVSVGESLTIHPGERIVIETNGPSSYLCRYG